MDRRNFLSTTLLGTSGVVLSASAYPFLRISKSPDGKKLFATTDYVDNVIINSRGSRYGTPVARNEEYYKQGKCYMDRAQLDALHKFLASIGVTRHQWMVNTIWNMYEDYPHGFDLLEEVTKSAHKYGIELFAVIKPFEGCSTFSIPHTMPVPEKSLVYQDLRGIFPRLRDFVAENPSLSLKCRKGAFECDSPITSIRLVKGDNRPTRVKPEHLSVYTSPTNNGYEPYNGPLSFSESFERRFRFPYWRECRVIHLNDLEIPEGHRYVLIRCSLADAHGDFSNEKGNIIELLGKNGEILPHTLSTGPVSFEKHYESFFNSKVMQQLVPYLHHPEVKDEIADMEKMKHHYENFYGFGYIHPNEWTTLDKDGFVAAAFGKPEFMIGALNPVYTKVRKHWLYLTRFCLERGVDGINYRIANHINITDSHLYGFNSPTLKATKGDAGYTEISRANGDAYTLFMKEAREMIKKHEKKMVLHLHSELLILDERPNKACALPPNIEWQWKKWVAEIADELEFRGIFKLRPHSLGKVINIFGTAAQKAGKPFYLQGDFHGRSFERPFLSTKEELELVEQEDMLDGYILYETANFTRINEKGGIEGSPELLKVL